MCCPSLRWSIQVGGNKVQNQQHRSRETDEKQKQTQEIVWDTYIPSAHIPLVRKYLFCIACASELAALSLFMSGCQ